MCSNISGKHIELPPTIEKADRLTRHSLVLRPRGNDSPSKKGLSCTCSPGTNRRHGSLGRSLGVANTPYSTAIPAPLAYSLEYVRPGRTSLKAASPSFFSQGLCRHWMENRGNDKYACPANRHPSANILSQNTHRSMALKGCWAFASCLTSYHASCHHASGFQGETIPAHLPSPRITRSHAW